jgi:CHAT domain-containing protein
MIKINGAVADVDGLFYIRFVCMHNIVSSFEIRDAVSSCFARRNGFFCCSRMKCIQKAFIVLASCIAFVLSVPNYGCGPSPELKLERADKLSSLAQSFFDQQKYGDVVKSLSEAIALNTDLERDSSLGENYLRLARTHRLLGEYDSAFADFKTTLDFFRKSGDNKFERSGKIALAGFYYSLHEDAAAASLASDAATEAKFFMNTSDLYQSLMIVAEANHRLEHYDKELRTLGELALIDSTKYASRYRFDLLKLKLQSYARAGQNDMSRTIFNQWKSSAISAGDTVALARLYYTWGGVQQSLLHPDSALRSFSQALGLLNVSNDRPLQSEVILSLGNLAYSSKHFDNARLYYKDAKGSAHQSNDIVGEQFLKLLLASCDWKLGAGSVKNGGADLANQVSSIKEECHQTGFYAGEALADFLLARFAEQRNDPTAAMKLYLEAQGLYEQSAGFLSDEPDARELLDVFFDAEQSDWFDAPLQLYCSVEKADEAFTEIERKNLNDCAEFFSRLTMKTSDANLNSHIADFQWRRKALGLLESDILRELRTGKQRDLDLLQSLTALHPQRVNELDSLAKEIGTVNPNFQWLIHPKPLTLKEAQSALPANSALVEFAPLATGLSIIVITHDTVFIRRSSVNKQTILSMIQEYNRLIGDSRLYGNVPMFNEGGALNRINDLSLALYNNLIVPLLPVLNNSTNLYVVPPAEFGWLPFHTLSPEEGPPLIDRYCISNLPSAAVLLFNQQKEKFVQNVVGFGYPGRTSWDVEYELKDIRSFYEKAKMIFNTTATLDHLAGAQYDVLHVGAEFAVSTNVPNNSVIILSDGTTPDGLREVPLGDLLAVPVPPVLVFSNITPKAGGLARYVPMAFLANGTQTVVATVWQGERKAKKYFGEVFYTSLMAGVPSGQAYQQAMVALTKRDEFAQLHRWGLYYRYGK